MAADDHLDGRDVDAEFAAIVAALDSVPDLPPALTSGPDEDPASATLATGAHDAAVEPEVDTVDARDGVAAVDPVDAPQSVTARPTPPPGIVEAGLEEGHFVPPPVTLPPQEDLHFWGIVVGLTLGPILLLWKALFGEGHSSYWTYAALGLIIGGFTLLVLRQPTTRDEDDSDSGARV